MATKTKSKARCWTGLRMLPSSTGPRSCRLPLIIQKSGSTSPGARDSCCRARVILRLLAFRGQCHATLVRRNRGDLLFLRARLEQFLALVAASPDLRQEVAIPIAVEPQGSHPTH